MLSAMTSATVGLSDMDEGLRLFRDAMGLSVERDDRVPEDLLRAWGVDAGTQARRVELSCGGYPVGRLRLVQFDPPATQKVRIDHGSDAPDAPTDVGPKALDFYVRDPIVDSVKAIEAVGYAFRSPPVKHQIGTTVSEELLFSGPDGIPILLMVGHVHAASSQRPLPEGVLFSEVPTISVVAGDLEASRRFYGEVLGLEIGTDAETPDEYRDLVCDLTGVPRGSRIHFLMYQRLDEPSGKLLLVHFFDGTTKRLRGRMKPGNLGLSLFTHASDDVDALAARAAQAGADVVSPPADVDGKRHMLLRGPNEELFEIVSA